ncbi:hypothetical protein mRhiFer1_008873 [Rhinolophus ferrumequinum]|uniref:Uncharacterized protein n=1 Tax=Rhinolophus ferrumequinum TaxID=59479 RepID=A0A7J8AFS1_RHIFE|nr:hypothetical protein mRhiFer1_008873 [Rhinolophus ferrumequinum]
MNEEVAWLGGECGRRKERRDGRSGGGRAGEITVLFKNPPVTFYTFLRLDYPMIGTFLSDLKQQLITVFTYGQHSIKQEFQYNIPKQAALPAAAKDARRHSSSGSCLPRLGALGPQLRTGWAPSRW